MAKIDRRKNYFLVLDTETANGLEDALVYDCGYVVTDKAGTIYHKASFIVYDIFISEKDMMQSAYYAEKISDYEKDLVKSKRKLVNFFTLGKEIKAIMKEYNIKQVWAYNALFDINALNTTQRYLTKSKYRFFFPFGTKINCIWSVACQTICKQKSYFSFTKKNNFLTSRGIKTSAEIVYRYLKDDATIEEEHTALEDAIIETEILSRCLRQHKAIKKFPVRFPMGQVAKAFKIWNEKELAI